MPSYHYKLLSPWHRHTEMLNGRSSYSTVLQRQVKAEEEGMLASASAPEHRTIALEANFIGECCPPSRTASKRNFRSKFSWRLKHVFFQKTCPPC